MIRDRSATRGGLAIQPPVVRINTTPTQQAANQDAAFKKDIDLFPDHLIQVRFLGTPPLVMKGHGNSNRRRLNKLGP